MSLNLYPWNNYILFLALAVVLVFLLILVRHCFAAVNTLKEMVPVLEDMSKKATVLSDKADAASTSLSNGVSGAKTLATVWLTFSTLKHAYQSQDKTGFEGVSNAASTVRKERSDEKKLVKKIKKELK